MDFDWSPELRALRAEAEEVAGKAIAAHGQHDDAWINGYSREFSRELGRRGWIGMTWPTEHGGGGRSALERFVVTEALIELGAPIAAAWFADRQMGPTLIAYGNDDQKRRFLPGILAGETGWCIGMSEPDAGSDLASLDHPRRPGRRRVRHQRPEDLDQLRRDRRLLLPHLPDVDATARSTRASPRSSCPSTRPASPSARSRT